MRKYRFSILVLLLFGLCLAAGYGLVSAGADDVGENPIQGINEDRSQILVSGENYALNSDQEEKYEEEQEKKKEQRQEQEQRGAENNFQQRLEEKVQESESGKNVNGEIEGNQPGNGENGSGNGESGGDKPPEPLPEPGGEEENTKTPVIITSLSDGQTVEGLRLVFTVEGKDYRGNRIESFNFDVKVNGIKVYSAGQNTYERTYRGELSDGANEIVITIKDDEGNAVTNYYKVYANKDGQMEEGGTVTVTMDTSVLGLGIKFIDTATFYEGDNVSDVILRAIENNGYDYVGGLTGTAAVGWYLSEVTGAGITDGYKIPDPILQKLEEYGATKQGHERDSLGEMDFYKNSGWMYRYNGELLMSGMSNINVCDGDEIHLYFTLNLGYEYDGTWFNGSW
ncbi:MAG: DUF4430 domain-containing protein [Emergencia sp.]|nr:DUF4430 domain-containing protein [Emergencia sp.]